LRDALEYIYFHWLGRCIFSGISNKAQYIH
jgi:hypothetical protein